jgi:Kae1-associated kinase Bud32
MKNLSLDTSEKNKILTVCREVAAEMKIVAVLRYDPFLQVPEGEKRSFRVILVLESPKLVLRQQQKRREDIVVSVLAVDRKSFEKDVESDWLGGFLAENLVTPYESLVNEGYLWQMEVQTKKRLVTEILDNLVLEYPEMSHELMVKPEYFIFEAMARKVSLYPPMACRFLILLEGNSKAQNLRSMKKGFDAALKMAADEGIITQTKGYIKILPKHVSALQRRKKRAISLLMDVRATMLRHGLEVFPNMARSLMDEYGVYVERFKDPKSLRMMQLPELEDTKRYIFVPTSTGLVAYSEKLGIEDLVQKTFPESLDSKVTFEKLGGVLNAVYTLRIQRPSEEQKLVVKSFRDWYGLKWFPLALWAIGSREFSVRGKSRLEREYAINRYLSKNGCNVPTLINVSPKEKLIFQEYIEGENLANLIQRIFSSKHETPELTSVIKRVGGEVAKIHGLNVALGDCKPENIIIGHDGRIWFVDLEQAERGGDQAWDLAELLYYSGRYAFLSSIEMVQKVTEAFIEGYLEGGGKTVNVRRAKSPRYVKVFSFFVPPHILYAISSVCRQKAMDTEAVDKKDHIRN